MGRYVRIAVLLALGVAAVWGGYVIAQEMRFRKHYRAAETALINQDFPRALSELEYCLQIKPDRLSARFRAARAARLAWDYDKAEKYLAECESDPMAKSARDIDLKFERACLRAQQGDFSEVEQDLQAKIRDGGAASLLAQEALTHGMVLLGHPDTRTSMENLLSQNPFHYRALLLRGKVTMEMGQAEMGIIDLTKALELLPTAFEAREYLARAQLHHGKPREAIAQFRALAQMYPDRVEPLVGQAMAYSDLYDFEQAKKLLEQALKLKPDDLPALMERGRLALHEGQAEKGQTWLERAVKNHPQDREALQLLWQLLIAQAKNDEAQKVRTELDNIEKALGKLHRENFAHGSVRAGLTIDEMLGIGKQLAALGRDEEAVPMLFAALRLDPRHAGVRLALANHYERQGEKHRAAWHRKQAEAHPK